jgi:hypothetical protein
MIPKRILTEEKVALEIDLKKLFGANVTDKGIRAAIADDLIQIILDRTAKGTGVNEGGGLVKFKKYSDEYTKSLEFKGFGKSQGKSEHEADWLNAVIN